MSVLHVQGALFKELDLDKGGQDQAGQVQIAGGLGRFPAATLHQQEYCNEKGNSHGRDAGGCTSATPKQQQQGTPPELH